MALKAFTLIELLVVVTIIVVLLALLTPALDRAINMAEDTKCLSNLRTIGTAQSLYLMDYKRAYPVITWYSQLLGEKPFNDNGSEGGGFQNSSAGRDATHRPLNEYLGFSGRLSKVPVAECPRDQGDFFANSAQNCYKQYGTSYIEATTFNGARDSWYRVKKVYGSNASPNSLRQNAISRTTNKILIADWPLYGDRYYDQPQSQWHDTNENGKVLNVLFADSHVEKYTFDNAYNDERIPPPDNNPNNGDAPASPDFFWW